MPILNALEAAIDRYPIESEQFQTVINLAAEIEKEVDKGITESED